MRDEKKQAERVVMRTLRQTMEAGIRPFSRAVAEGDFAKASQIVTGMATETLRKLGVGVDGLGVDGREADER